MCPCCGKKKPDASKYVDVRPMTEEDFAQERKIRKEMQEQEAKMEKIEKDNWLDGFDSPPRELS